jgi:hypothetical protein
MINYRDRDEMNPVEIKEQEIEMIQKGQCILGYYSFLEKLIVENKVNVTIKRNKYNRDRNMKRLDDLIAKVQVL